MILGVRACVSLSGITSRTRQTHRTPEPCLRRSFLHEVLASSPRPTAGWPLRISRSPTFSPVDTWLGLSGDVGWGEFARQLRYKAGWFDCELTVCDRWFPSTKTCHACGMVKQHMQLAERIFRCGGCGLVCDRDRNAAANLAAEVERVQTEAQAVARAEGHPRRMASEHLLGARRALAVVDRGVAAQLGELVAGVDLAGGAGLGAHRQGLGEGAAAVEADAAQ
jgi:hypothetical protein